LIFSFVCQSNQHHQAAALQNEVTPARTKKLTRFCLFSDISRAKFRTDWLQFVLRYPDRRLQAQEAIGFA